jgi:N-acetylglucosamine-6-phosphate deacetylase
MAGSRHPALEQSIQEGMTAVKIQIVGGYALLPAGIIKTDVEIEQGRITAIGVRAKDPHAVQVAAKGKYILPGFIDIHANGIAGFDLTNGVFDASTGTFRRNEEVYASGLETALTAFAQHGTTLVGLTILEAPRKRLLEILRRIAGYREKNTSPHNDMIFGVYLEGVFMKEKGFRGAHNPKYFCTPSLAFFKELQRAAKGSIRIVNVVPEWGKPALTLIEYLSSRGIVCAVGHSGATGTQYRAAIDKGSTLAIHVMNGPSSSSSKPFHGGGVLEVVLQSEDVFAEIIADGYHVDKSYVMDIVRRKGIERCVVVTDSMFVSTMKGIREFAMGGMRGKVSNNGTYLHLVDRGSALFGSVLTMDQAFQNVMNWFMTPLPGVWNLRHEACAFEEAMLKASHLCSASPAKALGVYEPSQRHPGHNLSHGCGDLAVGKRADLVVADIQHQHNAVALTVEVTIVNGNIMYPPS